MRKSYKLSQLVVLWMYPWLKKHSVYSPDLFKLHLQVRYISKVQKIVLRELRKNTKNQPFSCG